MAKSKIVFGDKDGYCLEAVDKIKLNKVLKN